MMRTMNSTCILWEWCIECASRWSTWRCWSGSTSSCTSPTSRSGGRVLCLRCEIDFVFSTTGGAICSEEKTCDSCVMKSLILSRHPPPSSEKGCEPLFPDLHLCQFYILTVVVVDQRDDWRGNKTGENVQEGQTQHGWIKNVPEGGGSDWTAKLFVFLLDERHILGG